MRVRSKLIMFRVRQKKSLWGGSKEINVGNESDARLVNRKTEKHITPRDDGLSSGNCELKVSGASCQRSWKEMGWAGFLSKKQSPHTGGVLAARPLSLWDRELPCSYLPWADSPSSVLLSDKSIQRMEGIPSALLRDVRASLWRQTSGEARMTASPDLK